MTPIADSRDVASGPRRPARHLRRLATYLRRAAALAGGAPRRLRDHFRRRRELLALRDGDARLRKDIGVTQADIDRALRRPGFWI